MTTKELIELIQRTARLTGVDQDLAVAICAQESSFDWTSCRYEPTWNYFFQVDQFARKLNITAQTEKQLQAFSWGTHQIMGSVARELGFEDDLPLLMQPELGVLYGCKKLQQLLKKYKVLSDVISAYNQGFPFKKNGVYNNQNYVVSVVQRIDNLKKI